MLPPSKAHAVENIMTQPSAVGPNPTISTVIKFSILLPNDALYCPSLTCGVYDHIFTGLSQPLVGNFVINIGELQHLQDETFEAEDVKIQDLIMQIQNKIDNAEDLKEDLLRAKEKAEADAEKELDLLKVKQDEEDIKNREELAIKTANQGNWRNINILLI